MDVNLHMCKRIQSFSNYLWGIWEKKFAVALLSELQEWILTELTQSNEYHPPCTWLLKTAGTGSEVNVCLHLAQWQSEEVCWELLGIVSCHPERNLRKRLLYMVAWNCYCHFTPKLWVTAGKAKKVEGTWNQGQEIKSVLKTLYLLSSNNES